MNHLTQPPAILIVDDDDATLRLLMYAAQNLAAPHLVLDAADGRSALRTLAEHHIMLMITDYLLPDMDGLDLTRAAKAASPTTYVVLISADDTPILRQRAQEQVVDLFLAKLDLMTTLADVLRRVLSAASFTSLPSYGPIASTWPGR